MDYIEVKLTSYLMQPKVHIEGNRLILRSSLCNQLLCLFSYCRKVFVDKDAQTITIRTKFLWFFSKVRVIPFGRIKRIEYSYSYFPFQLDWHRGESSRFEGFIVSVELYSPYERVRLFSFQGCDCAGDGFYFQGCQDFTSRSYVDLLREFTGKQLM